MDKRRYWRLNKLLIAGLLTVWGVVSFGFSILFAEPLSHATVGRLPMSFWWAQQGAMIVFVALIFIYAIVMDRLDARLDRPVEPPANEENVP
ncbi:MAG: DUF4212 domain-containing protein [Acidobacteria bacterium]|nr:DUF4212 domain-containing protein [Acidobacteriota bacterium]